MRSSYLPDIKPIKAGDCNDSFQSTMHTDMTTEDILDACDKMKLLADIELDYQVDGNENIKYPLPANQDEYCEDEHKFCLETSDRKESELDKYEWDDHLIPIEEDLHSSYLPELDLGISID